MNTKKPWVKRLGNGIADALILTILTRARLRDGSAPLAAAAIASGMAVGRNPAAMIFGSFLSGQLSEGPQLQAMIPFIASLMVALTHYLSRAFNRRGDAVCAASAGIGSLVARLLMGNDYTLYGMVEGLLTSSVALAAAPVMKSGIRGLRRPHGQSVDERIGTTLLLCGLLIGCNGSLVPISEMLAGYIVLLVADHGASGALAGVLCGVAARMAGAEISYAMMISCAGVATGIVRPFGRCASAAAYVAALPLAYLFGTSARFLPSIGAALLFLLTPVPWYARWRHGTTARLRVSICRRHESVDGGEVCGDGSRCTRIENGGRLLISLSDGMGVGARAAAESARALRLSNAFLEKGVDVPIALTAVNRLLCEPETNADEDMFATLDLCAIDLTRGGATFTKLGGCPSWIISARGVRRIEGGRPPLGILPEVPIQSARTIVRPGESILMMTDGLMDAIGGASGVERALHAWAHLAPADLCQCLTDAAQQRKKDDMSVICAKILRAG